MRLRTGDTLHLTLSGAGNRAVVSLNTYAVTQPALVEFPFSEDGFTFDVTHWLHLGRNILSVVLFGPAGTVPFRLLIEQSGMPAWTFDEAEFLPLAAPWRLWTYAIEVIERDTPATIGDHCGFVPGFLRRSDRPRTSA
ncbi:hypothetical protein [Methylobacterium nodulans]|uniref:Uncharacterized protein n=1 Tax=Methylobacterium nodulans (strain LMG 21967 / CNCM I-2342 / ORS 2060) TaxID=460265 RepID=B8IKQ1_METNO|nr:hypothetical protein [Methylobacterium nodulans]ACL56258.1 conserved hypothetical protein [Methylobacterium nodulans ORS 2060]